MAKDNSESTSPGSVDNIVDHKAAILNALNALQEVHTKGDEVWTDIENAKKDIGKEKNEEVLKAKRLILYEEFKKELDQILPEEK